MWILKSDSEVVQALSERCKAIRLAQNMTQQEVAARAGIALRTYRRFEQEGQISMDRFVAVVRALNRIGELEQLLLPPPVRDLRDLDVSEPTRKRAGKS